MGATAAIAGLSILGGSILGTKMGHADKAKADALTAQQNTLVQSAPNFAQDTQQASYAASQARLRQRRMAEGAAGRRATLLTGPLGIPGQAPATYKSLLGQ